MKKDTYHLIEQGDSLGMSPTVFACHIKPTNGMQGYFGFDGTLHRVTCGVCKKTKLYKKIKEELK